MKFYSINMSSGNKWITNIPDENIVVTVWQDGLKYITGDYAKEMGFEFGDRTDTLEIESEDLLADAKYASTFMGDYIDLDNLKDDSLYFDPYTDEFYSADTIRDWKTLSYIYDYDGSNFRMVEILDKREIEVELIDSDEYKTGSLKVFKIVSNGNIIKVDYSMYAGSRDTVEEGEEYVEEYEKDSK